MTGDAPVALVTGAAQGIGRAVADALLADGHRVAVADLAPPETWSSPIAADDASALALRCDVADRADVDAAVAATVERFGRLDVLVNNAGTTHIDAAADLAADAWDRVLAVNARGALACAQAAYPHLRTRGGAIVNVVSISQLRGQPGLAAYAASKGAVESLTRTLAVEWAGDGIRVNGVAPGHVLTPMVEQALASGALPQDEYAGWRRRIPLGGRLADPAEIASVVAFLAGDGARYVTGQLVVADGGLTINGTTG